MRTAVYNKMLTQTAIYWAPAGKDNYGMQTYSDPVEIPCRWQWKQELFVDDRGKEQISHAIVYINQDLELNGEIMLGDLDDLSSSQEEAPHDSGVDAYTIRSFAKSPDIEGRVYVRKVWL